MRRLDELHLDYPFAGARMLRSLLRREGVSVGRRHVTTLMKRMGISAIYRRPNTSKPAPGHKVYPYLLRGLKIERTMSGPWTSATFRCDGASSIWRRSSTSSAGACSPIASRSRWRRPFASTRSRRLWRDTAGHRSSTRIRAASSPASTSRVCCWTRRSPSAWTAKAPGATTCLLSGSGGRSRRGGLSARLRRRVRSACVDLQILDLLQWRTPTFEP